VNFLKNLFKRAKSQKADDMEVIRRRISKNQEMVYRAVVTVDRPCNGRTVADQLGWDSASVTNRLAELVRKGRIVIHHRKRGLDGIWRNYYVAVQPKINEHPGEL
jgi:DNA-binding MarR family transcriptional regulator